MSVMNFTEVTNVAQQTVGEKKRGGWWIIAQLAALAAISPCEVWQLYREKLTQSHNAAAESIHNCNNYHPGVICGHVGNSSEEDGIG